MNREDWALLVIAAARRGPMSPVQLQKSLFLLGQELSAAVGQPYYNFAPHNYGPFDRSVYADAELLRTRGLVAVEIAPSQRWAEYRATTDGVQRADDLAQNLSPEVNDYIQKVVNWCQSLTFQELVRAIYGKYPAFRANSVFRG